MRTAKFSIDSLPDLVFDGFTKDDNWNGWACPYFTLEEGNRILQAQLTVGVSAQFDEELDAFIFEFQREEEYYSAVKGGDRKFYPIENSYWIWEEI